MIVLSFDTDHMSETMMEVFLREVLPHDVAGTIFCTQPYACLDRPGLEVAIHPIMDRTIEWEAETTALRAQFAKPARGVRAHSCAYQQKYGVWLSQSGFDYISQVNLPVEADVAIYRHAWGIWEVPIRYMDNMDLWAVEKTGLSPRAFSPSIVEAALASRGDFCFDLHPIHLMLNTSSFADYEAWAARGRPELAAPVQHKGYGVRDFMHDLLAAMKAQGLRSYSCAEAVAVRAEAAA